MTNFSHFGPSFGCDVLTHLHTNIHRFYEPKYILDGFVNLTLRSKCYSEFFCVTFSFYTYGKRCSQIGPCPGYSQSQVVYAYHVLGLLLQRFVWPKYCFWPFLV